MFARSPYCFTAFAHVSPTLSACPFSNRAEVAMAQRQVAIAQDDAHMRAVEHATAIAVLNERVKAAELDVAANEHLAHDASSARMELDRKSIECEQHIVAVGNLHALLERLQEQQQQQQEQQRQHQLQAESNQSGQLVDARARADRAESEAVRWQSQAHAQVQH
jgi:Mg-chelatase subunit ChlI